MDVQRNLSSVFMDHSQAGDDHSMRVLIATLAMTGLVVSLTIVHAFLNI